MRVLRMLRLLALCTIIQVILCLMQRDNELECAVGVLLGLSVIFELPSRKKGKLQTIPLS